MSKYSTELLELSAMVVAAFVRHNRLPQADLAGLIEQTHAALGRLGQEPAVAPAEKPVPAVPIRKSVTPDAIYSLEDGKPFKSLKRHLRSAYDMSPEDYRAKWELPADYPMVAPNYAEARSQMAKSLGLGRKKGQVAPKRRNRKT
ncbi:MULTISPECIES: MucR family transcriptional regulator [unclassified Bosea (in: a-proteobacteria)]|uniref:MucR family transcriptional regulator n=1 Tax=unclassified Bosea (in: a-proteobacteria) TaxID=2653178 RepID=UPI000F75BE21|nr:MULTISPECIES: MucR family transcriptional regulator [unclassified Bosea (in: a-proteobacteria)]AZO80615.1 MucR family transcriptional regulator [Bosea sp. Tri-49]RXT25576.1 MucR family transcriptional regulator [Bosea sp. Tri-39]RXT30817.1 MucR family transcriptional regulator [Bosea sp. Tri-54]